jgi:lysophospholipase L1-like esterase
VSEAPSPIAFIGDSITEWWGFHRGDTFGAHGLINRGRSGYTARQIALHFRDDIAQTGARGVHLLCGVNDIARNEGVFVPAEEIARTIAGMLDAAREMGVRAWVGSITPAARVPWNPAVTDASAMIAAVNASLQAYAAEHGATFIDYHAVLIDGAGGLVARYGTDGLHLSPAGYLAIEPVMLGALGRVPHDPAPSRTVAGWVRRLVRGGPFQRGAR